MRAARELGEGIAFVGAMTVVALVAPVLCLGYGMTVAVLAGAEAMRKRFRQRG